MRKKKNYYVFTRNHQHPETFTLQTKRIPKDLR